MSDRITFSNIEPGRIPTLPAPRRKVIENVIHFLNRNHLARTSRVSLLAAGGFPGRGSLLRTIRPWRIGRRGLGRVRRVLVQPCFELANSFILPQDTFFKLRDSRFHHTPLSDDDHLSRRRNLLPQFGGNAQGFGRIKTALHVQRAVPGRSRKLMPSKNRRRASGDLNAYLACYRDNTAADRLAACSGKVKKPSSELSECSIQPGALDGQSNHIPEHR
jgi:hypothetical protein